jgi:hypothetical protein
VVNTKGRTGNRIPHYHIGRQRGSKDQATTGTVAERSQDHHQAGEFSSTPDDERAVDQQDALASTSGQREIARGVNDGEETIARPK